MPGIFAEGRGEDNAAKTRLSTLAMAGSPGFFCLAAYAKLVINE